MKKIRPLLVSSFLVVSLLSAGCAWMRPKAVEFGQSKVKPVPVTSPQETELQKQAADFVKTRTQKAKEKALVTQAAPEVVRAVTEAELVADGLSVSLGPPKDPWRDEAERLAGLLKNQQARFDAQLDAYRKAVAPHVGKKIEGTGLLKIGYFQMWGLAIGAVLLIGLGLKIYGMANPVVGAGVAAVSAVGRIGAGVVSKAFSEVVAGGEAFKEYVEKSPLTAEVKATVLDLFSRAHAEAQNDPAKEIVKKMTA
jgi:hypothetical protein